MITITTSRPNPPVGPYPQLRLWGHAGTAPNSRIIKIISRISPIWAVPQSHSARACRVAVRAWICAELGKGCASTFSEERLVRLGSDDWFDLVANVFNQARFARFYVESQEWLSI